MIYANFESISAPEDNGKQNSEESYANKYQTRVDCSYECVDESFKSLKSY